MYPCSRSGSVDTISGANPLTKEHRADFLNAVEACFGNGQPRIVFDMSLISLIDSAGLEALLEARDRCRKLGGNLVLAHPNSLCSDILRINGFEKWISIYDSAVKALGSFAR